MTVPFHYVGHRQRVPDRPEDSFFVANAAYVAARTGSDAVGTFLVDTGGRDTTAVADAGPRRGGHLGDGDRHRAHPLPRSGRA